MSSGKWRPSCLGLNELSDLDEPANEIIQTFMLSHNGETIETTRTMVPWKLFKPILHHNGINTASTETMVQFVAPFNLLFLQPSRRKADK